MRLIINCFILLFLFSSIHSQDSLSKFSFLEGNWRAEKWGGIVEEYWSAPNGDSIIGMFRFMQDGNLVFSEHFIINEIEDVISLKLRHFNPDFTSWEEKESFVEFKLIEAGEKFAKFEGLSYQLTEDGKLKVLLDMKQDGEIKTEEFIFEKF